MPQGFHGIHAGRATGGHVAGHEGDCHPDDSRCDVHRRRRRADAGLHRGERAARWDCEDFTDDDAYYRDGQTMQHHITKNRANLAPNAIRTPISCVRRLTRYAMTP